MLLVEKMNKIFIDIDNDTPGAIIKYIYAFIRPQCLLTAKYHPDFPLVNKYCLKALRPFRLKCSINVFCYKRLCKTHTHNYQKYKRIHNIVKKNIQSKHEYVHFASKDIADLAYPIFGCGDARTRCCYGKGFKIAFVVGCRWRK